MDQYNKKSGWYLMLIAVINIKSNAFKIKIYWFVILNFQHPSNHRRMSNYVKTASFVYLVKFLTCVFNLLLNRFNHRNQMQIIHKIFYTDVGKKLKNHILSEIHQKILKKTK